MSKGKDYILSTISILCMILAWINWCSCTDSNQSTDHYIRKTNSTETTCITYSHQVDSQKTILPPSVVSKPKKTKRIIHGKYDGKVKVQVDLFYCKIENNVLLNLLKSKIKQVSYKDQNKQLFASIDSGLHIKTAPITIFKSEIGDFSRSNFFTVIDDTIEIILGAEYDRSVRFLKSWISIDSTKAHKCEILCDTMCSDGFIEENICVREDIIYISPILSKNDSGKIILTQVQLDSITFAKKISETF